MGIKLGERPPSEGLSNLIETVNLCQLLAAGKPRVVSRSIVPVGERGAGGAISTSLGISLDTPKVVVT